MRNRLAKVNVLSLGDPEVVDPAVLTDFRTMLPCYIEQVSQWRCEEESRLEGLKVLSEAQQKEAAEVTTTTAEVNFTR